MGFGVCMIDKGIGYENMGPLWGYCGLSGFYINIMRIGGVIEG